MKIVSWNIAGRDVCWRSLLDSDYDIALLQEARRPPDEVASSEIRVSPGEWVTEGKVNRPWRTAIAIINPTIEVEWLEAKSIAEGDAGEFVVSRSGTVTAANITTKAGTVLTVVSAYTPWEKPLKELASVWMFADASSHRVISDISPLVGSQRGHRILVAGDWNALRGYGEKGSPYWRERYRTIFDRFDAIGLRFIGPEAPNGRQAEPWPGELPKDSLCVPTFHSSHMTPATAQRQLDFVFASPDVGAKVAARNEVAEWGPSDHCRVEIETDR